MAFSALLTRYEVEREFAQLDGYDRLHRALETHGAFIRARHVEAIRRAQAERDVCISIRRKSRPQIVIKPIGRSPELEAHAKIAGSWRHRR